MKENLKYRRLPELNELTCLALGKVAGIEDALEVVAIQVAELQADVKAATEALELS